MLEVIALPIVPQPLANSNRGIYWLVIESNCSLVDWAWSYYKITALSNLRVASLIGRYIRTYMPTVDWWKKSSHLTVTIHLNCLTGLIGFHKRAVSAASANTNLNRFICQVQCFCCYSCLGLSVKKRIIINISIASLLPYPLYQWPIL